MKRMEDAKKRYDEIPIPAELHARVQQEIAKADARRAAEMGQKRSAQRQATVIGVGQKWSTPVTDSVRSQAARLPKKQKFCLTFCPYPGIIMRVRRGMV